MHRAREEDLWTNITRRDDFRLCAAQSFDEPRPTVFLVRVRVDNPPRPGRVRFAISVSPSGDFPPGNSTRSPMFAAFAVGHSTIIRGEGRPRSRARAGAHRRHRDSSSPTNIFEERVLAGAFILNGAGELAGLTQAVEWGLIETPICLTNTLSSPGGRRDREVHDQPLSAGSASSTTVIIPVVASATTATSTTPRAGTSPTPTSSRRSTRRHPARSPRAWWARAPA